MTAFDEIEDFDEIEGAGSSDGNLDLSSIYNVIIGGFEAESGINTYLCSVRVNELEQDIDFYEKLTKDKSWPVSQIIQREVDKFRVSNISKSYILGAGRSIKYFPPIVVAILPKKEDGSISLEFNANDTVSEDIRTLIYEKSIYRDNVKLKDYFLNCDNLTHADGLHLLNVSKVFELNLLCWNKDDYYAIVIDGQHRLDALLKSKVENPKVGEFKQDMVFLDFSDFILNKDGEMSPVEVVRRVFIDINTNAKKVGVVRQILMDDKDLSSLMVQSLVDSVNIDGSDKSQTKYIQSELVDWYGKSLKHQVPHITGILSLYQIFNDYLVQNSLNSIDDLRSPSKVKKWVRNLNETFFVDQLIDGDITKLEDSQNIYLENVKLNDELSDDVGEEFKESELFTFDYRVLDIALDRFNEVFVESIIQVFQTFLPYIEVNRIINENDGFVKGSDLNMALTASSNKLSSSSTLRTQISTIRTTLHGENNDKFFLAYSVLFQKVLFYNLIQKITMANSFEFKNEECLVITTEYMGKVNSLFTYCSTQDFSLFGKKENLTISIEDEDLSDLGTIATSFWEGVIYENGNIIYNTQGIRTLSSFLELVLEFRDNEATENYSPQSISEIPYVKSRIKRIIEKQHHEYSEEEVATQVNEVLKLKDEYLKNYFFN